MLCTRAVRTLLDVATFYATSAGLQFKMPVSRLIGSPEELGVSPAALETLFAAGQKEVDEGRAQGCQVAVARHGRLAGMRSFGVTQTGPVTDETMFHIFSATKATMGVAVCKLIEEGKLRLSDRIADLIPGFDDNDGKRDDPYLKADMTLKHVVTFTAGFPNPPGEQGLNLDTSAGRTEWACSFGLEWAPGEFYQYHPGSGHWLMAEVVTRVTGMDFRDYLRSNVLDPCGLSHFYVGLPVDLQASTHCADIVTADRQNSGSYETGQGMSGMGHPAMVCIAIVLASLVSHMAALHVY